VRFDIYRQFQVEVVRESSRWKIYKLGLGIRCELNGIVLPDELREDEIATFLDDMFHEMARPGDSVRRIT
jgi:hypothetical protein